MEQVKPVWPTEFILRHKLVRILLIAVILVLFCVWIACYLAKEPKP